MWKPAAKAVMEPLWETIFHREKAAAWYVGLNVRDPRTKNDASHKHFLDVPKAAWKILNDGVEYDPRSLPR
jgi:hypothetical protein